MPIIDSRKIHNGIVCLPVCSDGDDFSIPAIAYIMAGAFAIRQSKTILARFYSRPNTIPRMTPFQRVRVRLAVRCQQEMV